MIIDWTYFFGERTIAQVTELSVKEALNLSIAKYEPKILICLFGQSLYDEFKTGLTNDPVAQKWLDLKKGCTYVDKYGVTRQFVGVANETTKESLIANYVYYHILGDGATVTTGTGEKVTAAENSTTSNPIAKQTRAWNEMVAWNKELRMFLQSTESSTYPEWNDPLKPPVYCSCRELFQTVNVMNW